MFKKYVNNEVCEGNLKQWIKWCLNENANDENLTQSSVNQDNIAPTLKNG